MAGVLCHGEFARSFQAGSTSLSLRRSGAICNPVFAGQLGHHAPRRTTTQHQTSTLDRSLPTATLFHPSPATAVTLLGL